MQRHDPATPALQAVALTQGAHVPSTRFRVTQHLPGLAAAGVSLRPLDARVGAYPPPGLAARAAWLPAALLDAWRRARAAGGAAVCLLQRELVSTLCTAEPFIRAPIAFDVDDAIFLGPRGPQVDRIARRASVVICGNAFVAGHFEAFAPVALLPTAVDTARFVPAPAREDDADPVIGWSGSSSGLPELEHLEEALRLVLQAVPRARLRVLADKPPKLPSLPADRVEWVPWSAAGEVAAIQSFDLGLMPLADTPWARGKCSFKMLLYMACGVPVVVSPVGMNVEVLAQGSPGLAASTRDEWVDAIRTLLADAAARARAGAEGRRIVVQRYAREVVTPRLAQLLRQAAGSAG